MHSLDDVFSQNWKMNEDYLRLLEDKGIAVSAQNKREEIGHTIILINNVDKYVFDSKDLDDRYNQFLENLLPKSRDDSKILPVENKSIISVGNGSIKQSKRQKVASAKQEFPQSKVNREMSVETNRQKQQSGKKNKGFNI